MHLNLLIANIVDNIGSRSELEAEYDKKFLSAVGLIPKEHDDPEDIYRNVIQQFNKNKKIIKRLCSLQSAPARQSVRDALELEAEGEFPAHWRDTKHEQDGTARNHIELLGGDKDEKPQKEQQNVDIDKFSSKGANVGAQSLIEQMNAIQQSDYEAVDDVSGAVLDEKMAREARRVEMEFFERMGVYTRVTMDDARKSGVGKFIQGRWIDINKGDTERPDYRSRFVGKEFNTGTDPELYAATPPLEALKLILADAAGRYGEGIHIMMSDVKRAYFHASAKREIYVQLPREDPHWAPG